MIKSSKKYSKKSNNKIKNKNNNLTIMEKQLLKKPTNHEKAKFSKDIQSNLVNITDDELFLKADLIKSLLTSILPALKEDDSIDEALDNHMNHERQKEIEKFASENNINLETLETIINEYEYSGIFPDGLIGQSIEAPFLKKITIIENIKGFIKNILKKYM